MPNITTSILVFSFAYECVHSYLCDMVFYGTLRLPNDDEVDGIPNSLFVFWL